MCSLQTNTPSSPADDSTRIAREINGLIDLGMLQAAKEVLDKSSSDRPDMLRAVQNYYFAVEDWPVAAAVGARLLKMQRQQTWHATYDAALALHYLGRSGEALKLLDNCEPGGSRLACCDHHYSRTCYLATVGRLREAFLELCAAHAATDCYWCKAFVDSDLRVMWQWLGDVRTPDAELVAALSADLWPDVIVRALSKKADFSLDSRDLALHPRLRQLVNYDSATATFYPKFTQLRSLKPWFKTRARWAVHRLIRARYQTRREQCKNSS